MKGSGCIHSRADFAEFSSRSNLIVESLYIDYGSALVTYRNEIESKGVQFPGRDAPEKVSGGG